MKESELSGAGINDDLTYRIIGCAMKVHGVLGNGFQEVIYQRALAIEFRKNGIKYEREKEMPLHYAGYKIGTRRVDFLVESIVMVELKALVKLEDVHLAQGLNYLVAYRVDKGLLLNFGAQSLEIKHLQTVCHDFYACHDSLRVTNHHCNWSSCNTLPVLVPSINNLQF